MNRRRLKRLVSLREHDEHRTRAALADASRLVNELVATREKLIEIRSREEAELTRTELAEADTLRRQHEHLLKLRLMLEDNDTRREEAETTHQEREQEWLEARRSVKSIETLLDRLDARERKQEELEQQKLIDSLTVLKHHMAEGKRT